MRKGLKNKVMSLICQHKLTNGGTANEKRLTEMMNGESNATALRNGTNAVITRMTRKAAKNGSLPRSQSRKT